jgi:hypothetical protein
MRDHRHEAGDDNTVGCPRNTFKQQKAARRRLLQIQSKCLEIGAGEGIRTLDPNLGKVVLYP